MIQVFAAAGGADKFIDDARVSINGKEAKKGNRVKESIVCIDGH